MQFSISSLLALTLSLSLASAAPAPSMEKRWDTVEVDFQGADSATKFSVQVTTGVSTSVPDNAVPQINPELSISYISYDRTLFSCTFSGEHEGQGAASPALACSGNNCQLGPPQPVYTVFCTDCTTGPYCDGYPSL